MSLFFEIKSRIVETGQRLAEREMVAGSDGNISARLDMTQFVITPSGLPKGRLRLEDLVVVDMDGKVIEGYRAPSSEIAMHLYVYRNRPDINASVHGHPPFATAFAVAGVRLERDVLPEVVLLVGDVPLTAYAPPGTGAVPESLAPYIKKHSAFMLANHGLLTIGRNLEEAYNRHETVEQYAKILHLARQLGDIKHIPAEDFTRLEQMRIRLEQSDRESD
ncbi:MAG: class II aldolase/adducin family protein [candidate division Zixibacteria bacterium]|nr:class II aldolase/adducin family protein [candidate division Zixibacteria bacterium]